MKRKTVDLENAHYSKDIIRQYEDPEYARAAAEYERQARAERAARARGKQGDYSYEEYLAARGQAKQQQSQPQGQMASSVPPQAARVPAGHGKGKKRKAPKKKKGCLGRLFKLILALVLLFVVGTGVFALMITSKLDRIDTDSENFAIDSQVAEDLSGYRNIAILGSDARKGEGYDGSRTDAIIILSINRKTSETKMISVMRDSYLKIRDGEGNLSLDKVTHAHAYGGGVDTVSSLNRNLDLNIEEFVIFNWKAVADTVDTLGGIEVNVKKNEIGDMNHYGKETARNVGGKYHRIKHKGVQTLDGVQATTYCRIRKNSGGDTGRAKRYKKIMGGVLKKMIASPGKLDDLSSKVMPEIRTNITRTQLLTLMYRAPFLDMGKSVSWPKDYYGGIINGVWYAVPQTLRSNVKWLHKKAFNQIDYVPSSTCRQISDEISATTNIY